MAVLEMTDKINEAMENNQFSIGVFVDLSKAFDTLNHYLISYITTVFVEYPMNGLNLIFPIVISMYIPINAQFLDRCYS